MHIYLLKVKYTISYKDLGPTTSLLAVEVKYDCSQKTLKLSQKQYIQEILERFQMSDC